MTRLTHPRLAVDYTSRIDPRALHAVGVTTVCRYISRYSWKAITQPEARELDAAGIGIAIVFEDGARNAWGGRAQGVSDATFAFAEAKRIFGGAGGGITFAVDADTAGHPEATDAYFDGVAGVAGKRNTGPYGSFEVVRHHANRGFGTLWQTYAWSGGQLDTRAQIYQYSNDHTIAGHGVDLDHIFYADYGQWNQRPQPADPLLIFPTDLPGGYGNERELVRQARGALEQPRKYRGYLKHSLYWKLKRHRDRVSRISRHEPPNFVRLRKHADWSDHRGVRWQQMNDLMKRIAKL